MQISSIRELRTRLRHLDFLDKIVIVIFFVSIAVAVYFMTLRHP